MLRLFSLGVFILLLTAGCSSETPTRNNDFVPLTSISIVAIPSIATQTSTALSVIGNFSGLFTRDITDQVVWSSDAPSVAGFVTGANPNRVSGLAPGTAVLTATVGGVSTKLNLTVTTATATTLTVTATSSTITEGLTTQFAASGTFSDGTTQDLTFDATWASSTPTVATVDDAIGSKGLAKGISPGTATISATFEGVSGTAQLTVTEVVLQSITVSPATPSMLSVSNGNFTATGQYSDGSTTDITSRVTWNSSIPAFATITTGGLATTLSPGTTTISASLNGISGTSKLKVTGGTLTGITMSPVNPSLVTGTTGKLTATGSFSNGSSRDITGAVNWSVDNTAAATFSTPGGNVALIKAAAVSTSSITASFGSVSANTGLTITAPTIKSLTISPLSLDLAVGTSERLTLTASFSDGTTQDVTASATWTSGADTIVSVDDDGGIAKGRVHALAAKATPVTITASFGLSTATAQITARTRILKTLTVSSNTSVTALGIGNQVKFTATATYSDATTQDVTEDTTWTTDKPNVAALADNQNQPGQVVAVDSGSAILTASFGNKTQNATITVP